MNETIKTTAEYLAELQTACEDVVAAQNEGKPSAEVDKLKADAKAALADYNKSLTGDFYAECMAQENPVQHFIKTRYIPHTVKTSFKQSTKTGMFTYKLSESLTKADLVAFADHAGHHFDMFPGKRTWWYATQKLAYLLANAYNKALSDNNPKFKYDVDSIAEMFVAEGVISAEADLTSQKTLTKAVQFVFDNITEGTKATTKDVKYITDLMVKKGKKACQVVFQSPDEMAELITDALYHQLTGTTYETLCNNG